jgi:chromosome segregation ATPase
VEAVIRERIRQTEEKTADLLARLSQADQDEQDLRKKIDRRRRELEQHQKRLASLEVGDLQSNFNILELKLILKI